MAIRRDDGALARRGQPKAAEARAFDMPWARLAEWRPSHGANATITNAIVDGAIRVTAAIAAIDGRPALSSAN